MMEARLGFAVLVLAMCALHLVWTASVKMTVWWQHRVSRRRGSVVKHGQPARRSDWYAFFHCADLVGQDPAQGEARPDLAARPVTERKLYRPRVNLT